MKRKNLLQSAIVLIAITGLLALAGCETVVEPDSYVTHDSTDGSDSVKDKTPALEIDDDILSQAGDPIEETDPLEQEEEIIEVRDWSLANESNPFIGTWSYSTTSTMGMNRGTTEYELEFKTDSTIVQKTTPPTGSPTTSTLYYLIKNDYIVISTTSGDNSKYQFQVIDNNKIKISSSITYTRVGAENPDADRTLNLTNGLDGYWRSNNITSSSYDWYAFNKNGTYHLYQYMNGISADKGEFSYYIDVKNSRFVSMDTSYTVKAYYYFTKSDDNAFSWKITSNGSALGFERFDGETFKVDLPEAGNWSLANESNPFIGTWGYSTTMMNSTTKYEYEFKTDSTIVQKTTASNGNVTTSNLYYLVKGNYIVISSTNGNCTKSQFTVNNNKEIKIGNTVYTRVGAENPDADRTFNLINGGLDGYWRSTNITSSSYDWYTFNKNGTYHVYQYKNGNPKDTDKGEFSYYIDWANNRLVTMDKSYTVTTYYYFTKTGDNAFSWKTTNSTSSSYPVLGFERFDGETFPNVENNGAGSGGNENNNGNGNGNSSGGGCC